MSFGRFFLLLLVLGVLAWSWPFWAPLALALLTGAAKVRDFGDIVAPLGLVMMVSSAFACLRLLRQPLITQPTQPSTPDVEFHAAGRSTALDVLRAVSPAQETQEFLRRQGVALRVHDGDVISMLGLKVGTLERLYAAYNQDTGAGVANAQITREFARLPAAPRFWFGLGGALLMLRGELWLAPIVAIVLWIAAHYGQRWLERRYAALIGARLIERLRLSQPVESYAPVSPADLADKDRTAAVS